LVEHCLPRWRVYTTYVYVVGGAEINVVVGGAPTPTWVVPVSIGTVVGIAGVAAARVDKVWVCVIPATAS
jgi:hypothetical protein